MTHELKLSSKWFEDVECQKKTFEVRKNDRNYKVGDTIILKEWNLLDCIYTGREIKRTITYILSSDEVASLSDGYVVLGIEPIVGHWITLKDEYGDVHEAVCSCCDSNGNHKWNFCPKCGTKMIDTKVSIIDKIRTEIEHAYCKVKDDYDKGRNYGLFMATQIIDKYNTERNE